MVKVKLNASPMAAIVSTASMIAGVSYLTFLSYRSEKKKKEEEDRFKKERDDILKIADLNGRINKIVYGKGKPFKEAEKCAFVYRYLMNFRSYILDANSKDQLERRIEKFNDLYDKLSSLAESVRDTAFLICTDEVERREKIAEEKKNEKKLAAERQYERDILDKKLGTALNIAGKLCTNGAFNPVQSIIEVSK